MSFEIGIGASRLGYELQRGWTEEKEKRKKYKEKFLLSESIGHWPLWGRSPKRGPTARPTNRLTNQPTDGLTKQGVELLST